MTTMIRISLSTDDFYRCKLTATSWADVLKCGRKEGSETRKLIYSFLNYANFHSLTRFSRNFLFHFQGAAKANEYQTAADRRMRHYRLLRQQVHELELDQRLLKRNLNEMQNHKLSDRVRSLEIEQKRLANANFNLSRQVSDFDKLHTSLLELLEDVEDIETKLDKTVPEIRREISKVEIDSAQLSSDQNILKEEDHNMAKTIQALAVSISTLQNERSKSLNLDSEVNNLKMEIEILKAAAALQSQNKVERSFNFV